jgi:hypothetical protein
LTLPSTTERESGLKPRGLQTGSTSQTKFSADTGVSSFPPLAQEKEKDSEATDNKRDIRFEFRMIDN